MRPVSPAFLRTLHGSHSIVARVTVCSTFQTGVQPIGTRLGVASGSVKLDAKANTRGTCDVTVVGTWPTSITDLLAPYGNEMFIERGVKYDDGTAEYVGLGYFRIQDITQTDDPTNSTIRVTGVDRMQAIIDGKLFLPRQFASGMTFGAIVSNLVNEIYPSANIIWDDNSVATATTRGLICDSDRFAFLNDAITSRGKIWYWDHNGNLAIMSVPSALQPVYEIRNGTNGVLVKATRKLSRANVFNAYVATGMSPDGNTPTFGTSVDNNPNSPTYFYGRFGQVPGFYSSQLLESNTACVTAARALLQQQLGVAYDVGFGTVPNPALEPYDPIRVQMTRNDAPRIHVLDTITIPLTNADVQQATTREQFVTLPS